MSLHSFDLQNNIPPSATQVTSPPPLSRLTAGKRGTPQNLYWSASCHPSLPAQSFRAAPSVKQVISAHPTKAAGTKMHFPRSALGNLNGKRGNIGGPDILCSQIWTPDTGILCPNVKREVCLLCHEGQFIFQTPEVASLSNVTTNCPSFVPCVSQTLHWSLLTCWSWVEEKNPKHSIKLSPMVKNHHVFFHQCSTQIDWQKLYLYPWSKGIDTSTDVAWMQLQQPAVVAS